MIFSWSASNCLFLEQLNKSVHFEVCISTVGRRTDFFARDPARVPITDFFGSVRRVEVNTTPVNLTAGAPHGPPILRSMSADKYHARMPGGESRTFGYMDSFPIDTLLKKA